MKMNNKKLTEPLPDIKVYDTDKYFITRIGGAFLMILIVLAVTIILIW